MQQSTGPQGAHERGFRDGVWADAARDGLHRELAGRLAAVADRSAGSTEVAYATDEATAWELHPARVAPLRLGVIPEGVPVVEMGPSGGTLTVALLSAGHPVLAWCRTEGEAELVRTRAAGWDGLDVVVGPAGRAAADAFGPGAVICLEAEDFGVEAVLDLAMEALGEDGVVVWGSTNDVSADRVLGYVEPGGAPWVAVDAWQAGETHRASSMGSDWAVHTFAAYPDAVAPATLVAERAFDLPDRVDFIDQLVRDGVAGRGRGPSLLVDARGAHRRLVGLGLGLHLAPAHLHVAHGPARSGPEIPLAHRPGAGRLPVWQAHLTVADTAGGRRIRRERAWPDAGLPGAAWLEQSVMPEDRYVVGANLEQRYLLASSSGRGADAVKLLADWGRWLQRHSAVADDESALSPFRNTTARPRGPVLPPTFLDPNLDNVVIDADGLRLVDDEWRVRGGLDLDLVVARCMFRLAQRLVDSGVPLHRPATITVDGLAMALSAEAGLPIGPSVLEEWRLAEAALLHLIHGLPEDAILAGLRADGAVHRLSGERLRHLPYDRLLADLLAADAERERLRGVEAGLLAEQARAAALEERVLVLERRLGTILRLPGVRQAVSLRRRLGAD